MNKLVSFLILLIPFVGSGQTWKLVETNTSKPYPYEYWITFEDLTLNPKVNDSTEFSSKAVEPTVFQILSKTVLTDIEKENIKICIRENPVRFNRRCGLKKNYQISMQI